MIEINCKELANKIKDGTRSVIAREKITPKLVIIQVGDDYASNKYVGNKVKSCSSVGILAEVMKISEQEATTTNLIERITKLNNDDVVDGIIVQLPLPKHVSTNLVTQAISPEKDIDCLTYENVGRLHLGKQIVVPCTPLGVMQLIYREVEGKSVLMIGRSNIVGKPLAELLTQSNATVTLAHSYSEYDVNKYDYVISAIGKAKSIVVKNENATLIDIGINSLDGKLVGDFDIENCICKAYTPVPGGVGQLTTAMVCSNTLSLALERRCLK